MPRHDHWSDEYCEFDGMDIAERRRQVLEIYVPDLVGSFLYYDRKEDQSLPRDAIDEMVEDGYLTCQEIIEAFGEGIVKSLGPLQAQAEARVDGV